MEGDCRPNAHYNDSRSCFRYCSAITGGMVKQLAGLAKLNAWPLVLPMGLTKLE
jgi:hypothetical protein